MKTFPYKGQNLSIKEISELQEVKLSESSLYWRIVKKGQSVEEAIKYPYNEAKKHAWKGKMLTSYKIAQDKDVSVSHSTIMSRLRRGWDIKKAALTLTESTVENSVSEPVNISFINNEKVSKTGDHQRERIKLIMAIPVNPKKCRYAAHRGVL